MLIAIRHGDTTSNAPGAKEKLRTPDVPLTPEGIKNMMHTADFMKKVSLGDPDKPILSSPYPRAMQSAQEIASKIGTDIKSEPGLSDWNLGNLRGQSVKDTLPIVFDYLDHPDKPLPGGESFNDYFNRTYPVLKSLVESPEMHTAVTHNRTMTLLHAMTESKGEPPDTDRLKQKGPVDPAGMMIVAPDWSQIHSEGFGPSRV
jgi:broad specificity phosphatase PhoE